jgi:hypothetical protein
MEHGIRGPGPKNAILGVLLVLCGTGLISTGVHPCLLAAHQPDPAHSQTSLMLWNRETMLGFSVESCFVEIRADRLNMLPERFSHIVLFLVKSVIAVFSVSFLAQWRGS